MQYIYFIECYGEIIFLFTNNRNAYKIIKKRFINILQIYDKLVF